MMVIKYIIAIFAIVFVGLGCTQVKQLGHIDQLLMLKGYSDEQDDMRKYVEEQDEKFDKLVKFVEEDNLDLSWSQDQIINEFGDPIFKEDINKNSKSKEKAKQRWVYRYAKQYVGGQKVCLYFDDSGNLKSWEHKK